MDFTVLPLATWVTYGLIFFLFTSIVLWYWSSNYLGKLEEDMKKPDNNIFPGINFAGHTIFLVISVFLMLFSVIYPILLVTGSITPLS